MLAYHVVGSATMRSGGMHRGEREDGSLVALTFVYIPLFHIRSPFLPATKIPDDHHSWGSTLFFSHVQHGVLK